MNKLKGVNNANLYDCASAVIAAMYALKADTQLIAMFLSYFLPLLSVLPAILQSVQYVQYVQWLIASGQLSAVPQATTVAQTPLVPTAAAGTPTVVPVAPRATTGSKFG
jgi:hypothetical protein